MLENFDCPICKKYHWEHIETYFYAKESEEIEKKSKFSSVCRKLKFVGQILLFARPRKHIASYKNVTSYLKLRRDIIFDLWFKGETEVRLKSIYCTTCGFACYTPRPEEKDIVEKYEYLKRYEPDQGGQIRQDSITKKMDYKRATRIYERCTKHLINKPIDVLDYGGGNGKMLIPFRDNSHRCHLIDYNDTPLEGITKLGNDINNCTIEKKFDVIICSHVLEHVSDISNLIKKLKQHLKSDGILYAESPQQIWANLRIEDDPVTHINFFTLNSFINLFFSNGYKILSKKQEISNYGLLKLEVIWVIAQYDTKESASLLPADIEAMLFPSRWYSIKKLYYLFIRKKLTE